MALPILNETPSYSMEVPSTGKKFKYRPYLVKEEKILLMANETKDREQIVNAIADTISACTFGKVDVRDLTTFDLLYIFLQMRAKSVGETATLYLPCESESCKQRNEYVMNLEDIKCPVVKRSHIIDINDNVSVEMKYPNYLMTDIEKETDGTFHLMANCIKAVITGDERIDINDEPIENVRAFLESMTRSQFKYLTDFIKELPTIEYTIDFHCYQCNHHNQIELKGIDNFF